MANDLTELKAELTQCAICLSNLKDPRSLPCLHSFCERCLKSSLRIFQNSLMPGIRSFKCPQCRKNTKIPTDGIEGFPKDFKANKIADFLKQTEAQNSEPVCDICKSHRNILKIFCINCMKHFCSECKEGVHNNPLFDGHVTICTGLLSSSNIPTTLCSSHLHEKTSHLCKTCDVQVCMQCLIHDHTEHDLIEIQNESTRVGSHVKEQFYLLQSLILDLQKKVQKLHTTAKHLQHNHELCTSQIKEQSKHLQEIINENKRKLLYEIDQIIYKSSRQLLNDKDNYERILKRSQNLLMKAYNILLYGNQMNGLEELHGIEEEIKAMQHQHLEISQYDGTGNDTIRHLEFIPMDNVTIGKIIEHSSSENCGINASMVEMDEVEGHRVLANEVSDILPDIIEDEPNQSKPVSHLRQKLCAEKYKETGHHTPVMTNNSNSSFMGRKIKNAVDNGQHQDHKKVERDEIQVHHYSENTAQNHAEKASKILHEKPTSNPSSLNKTSCYATSETEKLNSQVIICTNLNELNTGKKPQRSPHKLEPVNKLQARLVTILDRKGKGQGQLLKPFSVCFNKEGNIVVGELENRRLHIFDIHGNFKQILGQGHVTPQCIVFMDTGEYAVVDELTKSVKLLDTDSNIKTVPNKISFPCALSTFSDNTFIVTDSVFDSISKISIVGEILSQYSSHGNSLNDLDNPSALHVTENLTVFVTDTGNHQVKFLDKDLNLMYKFGCYGIQEGQLRYPRGITGCRDVLFVSDSGNDRIVMFSQSGKYKGCLLDKTSGIHNPAGLCFDDKSNILCIVLPDSNQVRIYKITTADLNSSLPRLPFPS